MAELQKGPQVISTSVLDTILCIYVCGKTNPAGNLWECRVSGGAGQVSRVAVLPWVADGSPRLARSTQDATGQIQQYARPVCAWTGVSVRPPGLEREQASTAQLVCSIN